MSIHTSLRWLALALLALSLVGCTTKPAPTLDFGRWVSPDQHRFLERFCDTGLDDPLHLVMVDSHWEGITVTAWGVDNNGFLQRTHGRFPILVEMTESQLEESIAVKTIKRHRAADAYRVLRTLILRNRTDQRPDDPNDIEFADGYFVVFPGCELARRSSTVMIEDYYQLYGDYEPDSLEYRIRGIELDIVSRTSPDEFAADTALRMLMILDDQGWGDE